jgi:hypothetical protein
MSKIFFYFLFVLIYTCNYAQKNNFGLIKEVFDSNKIAYKTFPITRGGLPSFFSLQSYSPSPKSQDTLGSCTSWASAYCAFTIVKSVESGFYVGAYDPLNLHNRLKALRNLEACTGGNLISQASSMLKNYGCPKYNNTNCGLASSNKTYSEKLYNYEYLSINTNSFKYAISQEKSPLVIACKYYTDGWGNIINLTNGTWNGDCNGIEDGAHAMVIIGYDDNKDGGAFLIQNSWGSEWGDNGCFWMRYSDMNKVIYEAYQYIPNPNKANNNNNNFSNNNSQQYYRFYNNCSLTTYITLSQYKLGSWVTKGWYPISSGSFVDLDISEREADNVYWMATANNGEYIDWVDNNNGTDMCFDRINAHEIYDNAINRQSANAPSCPNTAKFYKTEIESRNTMVSMNLTCPDIISRGGEDIKLTSQKEMSISFDEKSNIQWDGKSCIVDLYSTRIIEPLSENNTVEQYDLYYIKRNKIIHFIGSNLELVRIHYPKFSSKNNAESYLKVSKLDD